MKHPLEHAKISRIKVSHYRARRLAASIELAELLDRKIGDWSD